MPHTSEQGKPKPNIIKLGIMLTSQEVTGIKRTSADIIDKNEPLKRRLGEDEKKLRLFKGLVGLLVDGHSLSIEKIRSAGLNPNDVLGQARSLVRNYKVSHPGISNPVYSGWDRGTRIGGADPWKFLGDGSGRDSEE